MELTNYKVVLKWIITSPSECMKKFSVFHYNAVGVFEACNLRSIAPNLQIPSKDLSSSRLHAALGRKEPNIAKASQSHIYTIFRVLLLARGW